MKAPCPYLRNCSGCPSLRLPYDRQLRDKNLLVEKQLRVFWGSAPDSRSGLRSIVESPLVMGYRASVKLCLSEDARGRRSIGLYKRGTKTVIDIPKCPVQFQGINALVDKIFRGPKPLPAPFYIHTRSFQPAKFKFLTVRVCPQTGQYGLIISHTGIPQPILAKWAKGLRLKDVSIFASELTRKDQDRIISAACQHLAGPDSFHFRIAEHDFALPPLVFFQANYSLTEDFVRYISQCKGEGDILLDLYGGFGAYSFSAQRNFNKIFVVDGNESAIEAARLARERYEYKNIFASYAAIEDFLSNRLTAANARRVSHIIVNPPRAGLSAKVRSYLKRPDWAKLRALTYVSCNPASLRDDLKDLVEGGRWQVEEVQPFDMFPQTGHVETVVRLRYRRQRLGGF